MNALPNNLVSLHQGSVYEDIQAFLSECGESSKSTAIAYERGLTLFFDWVTNGKKSLAQLTPDDLNVKNATVIRYKNHLIENGRHGEGNKEKYANNTINKYLSSIFSLYVFLEKNNYDVKSSHVKVKMLLLNKKKNKHGEMNDLEAKKAREYVRKQRKGIEKAALLRMAYTTSFRKSELLNLEWTDIKRHPSQDVFVATVIGKGGVENEIAISEDMYEELLTIKEQKYYQRYNDEKVFHLSLTTIQSMMNDLNENLQFQDEKGVVFHSFRNVMGGWLEDTGASLEEIKEHMNHANSTTYDEHYRHSKKDFTNSPSVRFEEEIEDDIFDCLGEEDLRELIMLQRGAVLSQLKLSAQKMIDQKESGE